MGSRKTFRPLEISDRLPETPEYSALQLRGIGTLDDSQVLRPTQTLSAAADVYMRTPAPGSPALFSKLARADNQTGSGQRGNLDSRGRTRINYSKT